MFLDCALLTLLVLMQQPKKDAGAGMAFGGAASDALFGAGSGNVLTKITKYLAGGFFGLALVMAVIASHKPQSGAASFTEKLSEGGPASSTAPTIPQTTSSPAGPGSQFLDLSNTLPAGPATNAPAGAVSNAPAPPPAKGTNNAPATAPASGTNK